MSAGYAVLDLETTGLFVGQGHRIVEIGVVLVTDAGEVTGRWESVVHPDRDLGPTRIHGLRGADMIHAPRFVEIADELGSLLDGRVVVAHNASFDVGFLEAELARAGSLAEATFPAVALCTLRTGRQLLPGIDSSLAGYCAALGITNRGAHTALADAEATAELLSHYLHIQPDPAFWRATRATPFDARSLTRLGKRGTAMPRRSTTSMSTAMVGTLPGDSAEPISLLPGHRIALTGETQRGRAEWEARLAAYGCIVQANVTKKTDTLIAADPDSLSGKANTARRYGIPIKSEYWLQQQLG